MSQTKIKSSIYYTIQKPPKHKLTSFEISNKLG